MPPPIATPALPNSRRRPNPDMSTVLLVVFMQSVSPEGSALLLPCGGEIRGDIGHEQASRWPSLKQVFAPSRGEPLSTGSRYALARRRHH